MKKCPCARRARQVPGDSNRSRGRRAITCAQRQPDGTACWRPFRTAGEGFLDVFSGLGGPDGRGHGPLGQEVTVPWALGRDPDDPSKPVASVESALAIGLSVAGGPPQRPRPGQQCRVRPARGGGGQGRRQTGRYRGGRFGDDGWWSRGGGSAGPLGRPLSTEVVVACDVETLFLDAAAVFSPQKGASPAQVELLTRRLERLAQLYGNALALTCVTLPGAGAAGGLAGGLVAIGAKLVPGFDVVAEKLALAERVAAADLWSRGRASWTSRASLAKRLAGRPLGGCGRRPGIDRRWRRPEGSWRPLCFGRWSGSGARGRQPYRHISGATSWLGPSLDGGRRCVTQAVADGSAPAGRDKAAVAGRRRAPNIGVNHPERLRDGPVDAAATSGTGQGAVACSGTWCQRPRR